MSREDALTKLESWRDAGGEYRVVHLSDETAIVDLCTCHGETMERLESGEQRLIEHLRREPEQ